MIGNLVKFQLIQTLINMTNYNLFLSLTIATIVSQLVHTWFVFHSFSRLKGWLKTFQSVMFCGILSVAILAFVLIGKSNLALLGAIIEVVINIYYYAMDFFEKGIKIGSRTEDRQEGIKRRNNAIITFWRVNWIAMFFGILLPMLIFVFAKQMIELK
jgi:hypothetical protein